MKIGLFASDIDGTLLPYGVKEVSPRTKNAVKRCRELDVPFVIASGRWFASARHVARMLGQTEGYIVTADGGAVFSLDGTPVREWRMTDAQTEQIHGISLKYDVMRIAFTPKALYRTNPAACGRAYPDRTDYDGGFSEFCTDAETFAREGLKSPYKMDFYTDDPVALRSLRKELEAEGFTVVSSWPTNIEVMAPGTGKGIAVRWLAEKLGVRPENVMGFGDNTNDADLLENVGWPVAVGNAADALKQKARIVCDRCEEDGVAKMIEKALGGEL